jgi:hypothetical protein
MKELHEMVERLKKLGATDEDIKKIWMIAIETTNEITKESR